MRDLRLAKFVEEQQVRRLALLREEERIRLEVVKLMRESAQGPPPPVKHGGAGSPGGAPSAAATAAALAAADSISGGGSGGSGGGSGGGGGGSGGAGGDSAEISQLGGGDLYARHASHFGGGPGPATAGPGAARGTLGMVSTAPLGHGSTLMSLGGESVWASQEFADAAGSGLRSPGRERGPSANEEGFDDGGDGGDGGGNGGDGGGGDGAASSAFPSRSITRAGGSRTGASLRLAAGAGADGGQSSSKLGSGSAAESGFGASPPGLRTGATSGSFACASPGAGGFESGLSGAGSASGFEGAGRPVLMTAASTLSGGSAFDGETRDLTTLLPPSAPASPRLPEEGAGMGASAGAAAGAGLGANASASAGVSAGASFASAVAADGGDGGAIVAELLDKLRAATSEAKARLPSTPTMHAKRGGGEGEGEGKGEAKMMDALELAPPHDPAAAPEPVAAASAAVAAGDAAGAEETKAAE